MTSLRKSSARNNHIYVITHSFPHHTSYKKRKNSSRRCRITKEHTVSSNTIHLCLVQAERVEWNAIQISYIRQMTSKQNDTWTGTIDEITNAPGTPANFQQDDPESSQGLVSPRKINKDILMSNIHGFKSF
uniref:Uncharacterized protein n=1 Tax=Solanum bulbocastanum TaxID=147425 RepID=Q17U55_SOLBU|nr:hypothetical protein SBB1_14t00020 [Solanum bulbocastanum]